MRTGNSWHEKKNSILLLILPVEPLRLIIMTNTFKVLDAHGDKVGTVVESESGEFTAYTLSDIEVYTGESFEVALWAVREGAYL